MINAANLRKRLVFVVFAVPIAWIIVNSQFSITPAPLPPIYPGQLLIMVIILTAVYEYTRMLGIFYPFNGFWLSYLWIIAMSVAYLFNYQLEGNISIYVLLMLVAFETFIFGKRNQRKRWVRASLFFSGTVFLYIASISMLGFYRVPFQALFSVPSSNPMLSQLGIVTVLTSIFMCDSAAYLVGSAIGRHHFSSISPNKTVEGSVAGLAASAIIFTTGWIFIRNPKFSIIMGPIIGILIGIMAQVGDLLVSLIKRYFKVKDSSTIIPGHGGVLDRFDSVFFTAPILYLFAWIVTR